MSSEQLFIESACKHEIAEASEGEHVSGGLLTNSPFGLPHTRQRHDTLSSRWPAAEKRRRGKRI